ncbi:hypothetical protein AAG906_009946 [Vitis piasezkii]
MSLTGLENGCGDNGKWVWERRKWVSNGIGTRVWKMYENIGMGMYDEYRFVGHSDREHHPELHHLNLLRTLKLPVLWQLPLFAESTKELDGEVMSNQPSYETAPPFYLSKSIALGLDSPWRLPFLPSPPNYRNMLAVNESVTYQKIPWRTDSSSTNKRNINPILSKIFHQNIGTNASSSSKREASVPQNGSTSHHHALSVGEKVVITGFSSPYCD